MSGFRSAGPTTRLIVTFRISIFCLFTSLAAFPSGSWAQQPILYQDARKDYENLVKEYDQGYYSRCITSAEKFLGSYQDATFQQLRLDAELYSLKSKLRTDAPGAIEEVLAFAKNNAPGAVSQRAILLAG